MSVEDVWRAAHAELGGKCARLATVQQGHIVVASPPPAACVMQPTKTSLEVQPRVMPGLQQGGLQQGGLVLWRQVTAEVSAYSLR